jgi:carboxylesterase type B
MSKVWQPLDPDIVKRIVPEYVEFHKTYLMHRPREDQLPWDPACRQHGSIFSSDVLSVGMIADYAMSNCALRVFTPEGDAPADGWPIFIFFHGGKPLMFHR